MTTIPSSFYSLLGADALGGTSAQNSDQSSSTSDSFESLLAAVNNDNGNSTGTTGSGAVFNFLNQMMIDNTQFLNSMMNSTGNTTTANADTDPLATSTDASGANTNLTYDYSTDFGQEVLNGQGPLPAYLKEVDTIDGLSSTQAKALQDIAVEFQAAPANDTTVQNIAAALDKAGIPETPV